MARQQHTVSLNTDEKKRIDDAAGPEGFSPYVRRQMLIIADEEAEYKEAKKKKNEKRK